MLITNPMPVKILSVDELNLEFLRSFIKTARNVTDRRKFEDVPQRRRLQLKRLLSQEMDILQIALELGYRVRFVEELILYLHWGDFYQAARFKKADRRAWSARQKVMADPEQIDCLNKSINWAKKVLRDEGQLGSGGIQTDMIIDLVEEEAKCCFINCLRNWDEERGAKFSTYFLNIWKLRLLKIKKKVCEMYEEKTPSL